MRHERAIELSPGRDAVVLEARVADMRRLLALLPDELSELDLLALVRARLSDLLAALGHCLRLPAGETIDNLTLSEIDAIGAAWWELHQSFFLRALAVAGYAPTSAPDAPISTEPA